MTECIRRLSVVHPYFFRSYTRSAWLAVLIAFSMPATSVAAVSPAERLEMIRGCEAVIIDQSFAPLSGYDPAPFSSGAPGEKSYAVYNHPRNIVTIAKVADDKWIECTVRETERDILSIPERFAEWRKEFVVAFPKPGYRWLRRTLDASSTDPFAARCKGDQLVVFAFGHWSHGHLFSVTLTNEPSVNFPKNPCLYGDS
jgi:hypothetical protein